MKEEGSLRRARKLSEEKKKAVAGFDPEVFYCSFCCLESVYRDLKLAHLSDALFSDLIDYASVGSLRFFVCVLGICLFVVSLFFYFGEYLLAWNTCLVSLSG